MTKTIEQHEGKKYLKTIRSSLTGETIQVDVYDVITAFKGPTCCPAQAHALKKLLCTGTRGKGDELADLLGVEAAVSRAIELCKNQRLTLAERLAVAGAIIVAKDGRCICSCVDSCPLGKTGTAIRCTKEELASACIPYFTKETQS